MIGVQFEKDKRDYKVWGEYSTDEKSGVITWFCREYYGDGTVYLTTLEINEALAKPTDRAAKIAADRELYGELW